MLLSFPNSEPFATSAQPYISRPLGPGDPSNRLMIEIEVGGITTSAVVDTGAPYLILEPALASTLGIRSDSAFSSVNLLIRGHRTAGFLHRVDVVLRAERGEEISVDATAFVPGVGDAWDLPSFIGWSGFLERFRFAVDPSDETFYFGPCP